MRLDLFVLRCAAFDPSAESRRAQAATQRIPERIARNIRGERGPERKKRTNVPEKNSCEVDDEIRKQEMVAGECSDLRGECVQGFDCSRLGVERNWRAAFEKKPARVYIIDYDCRSARNRAVGMASIA